MIIPSTPLEDDNIEIDELEIFACFHEVKTVVTTSPTGTTTKRATTTRFTSSGTTVSTVTTALLPDTTTG